MLKEVFEYQKDVKAKIRGLSKVSEDPLAAAIKLEEDKDLERKEAEGRVRDAILIE